MLKRISLFWALALLCCLSAAAQQAAPPQPQPLTIFYDYTVQPGREEDFNTLVKTVGEPVREKLMADGVVIAWGIETPLLRGPGVSTHTIWVTVNNWDGVGKVFQAMSDQLAKIAADEAKATKKPAMTTAQRARETFDASKTRDWLTRDIVFKVTDKAPPANALPFTRYSITKVKPGKGMEYRRTWEKYNKPVLDKLVADGVLLGYGLGVEELKTEGSFTHFVWQSFNSMGDYDKVVAAFAADRARRGEEERAAITAAFQAVTEPDAARQWVNRSTKFRVAMPK